MSTCTCPRIDGYRIRSRACVAHNECLDSIGPIPKLDGETFVCTKPKGHDMPHEAPDGTWWEPHGDVKNALRGTGIAANTWQSAARRLADENRVLRDRLAAIAHITAPAAQPRDDQGEGVAR